MNIFTNSVAFAKISDIISMFANFRNHTLEVGMAYKIEIDLHGHTTDSARRLLTQRLKSLPKDDREVHIIHGFHGGTSLQTLVRTYKNSKILGLNQGTTIYIIKEQK